jgi:hypothetical protein
LKTSTMKFTSFAVVNKAVDMENSQTALTLVTKFFSFLCKV